MSKRYVDFCKNWFDNHPEYSVKQKVIWIHDLYQEYEITEKEEDELYAYVDPDDTIQNPAELWFDDDSVNELENALNVSGIRYTTTIRDICKDIEWDNFPQSVDVYFINKDGEPDSTQFDLYSNDKTSELEELWNDQYEEIMNAHIDSVDEVYLHDRIVEE